jgi:hypothetical protein
MFKFLIYDDCGFHDAFFYYFAVYLTNKAYDLSFLHYNKLTNIMDSYKYILVLL